MSLLFYICVTDDYSLRQQISFYCFPSYCLIWLDLKLPYFQERRPRPSPYFVPNGICCWLKKINFVWRVFQSHWRNKILEKEGFTNDKVIKMGRCRRSERLFHMSGDAWLVDPLLSLCWVSTHCRKFKWKGIVVKQFYTTFFPNYFGTTNAWFLVRFEMYGKKSAWSAL